MMETSIGLEVHVQLATRSKMFCADAVEFGAPPNSHVCPVCLGLPGALPVVNGRAIELAVIAALGLRATLHPTSVFVRKSYFYPDLPKGYQITQYDRPLATGGALEAAADSASSGETAVPVRIRRIHLEEDAGKSLHDRFPDRTAIDLNRAGVPLIEIVTEPDLDSPGQTRRWLVRLKQLMEYLEVGECDMDKGGLRVDANVSVRPPGAPLGVVTELKNLNSFSALERALAFEIERQSTLLESGGTVVSETRLWDDRSGVARPTRSKQQGREYRYFPDPDLPPLVFHPEDVQRLRDRLPEPPDVRLARFRSAYALPAYDATVLTATRRDADYYEAVVAAGADPKLASHWILTEVMALATRVESADARPSPSHLAELLDLVATGAISASIGKRVLRRMAGLGAAPSEIVAAERLTRIDDEARLERWVREATASHLEEVARYRAGESRLLGFFMGEVMRRSDERADPATARRLLLRELER